MRDQGIFVSGGPGQSAQKKALITFFFCFFFVFFSPQLFTEGFFKVQEGVQLFPGGDPIAYSL